MTLSVAYGITLKDSDDPHILTAEMVLNALLKLEYLERIGWIIFHF